MCLAVLTLRSDHFEAAARLSTSDWSLYYGVQIETKIKTSSRAGVSLKKKRCVFAAAPDFKAGFLIANGQSGLFAELFVLAEANKQMI